MKRILFAVLLFLVLAAGLSFAGDAGTIRIAYLDNPVSTGDVADTSYVLTWLDSDTPAPNQSVTIDFFYTSETPPTFAAGEMPQTLTGTAVARGVSEPDPTNTLTWDTSAVPPGNYFLWTISHIVPRPAAHVDVVAWAPGIVTIAHPGDELMPAVVLLEPNGPIELADQSFKVKYSAFDPDGTGRVTIETTMSRDGSGLEAIARDLPAEMNGMFEWNTSMLAEGVWTLRATIEDARGRSFSAYARYFLTVDHLFLGDAGAGDSGVLDAEARDAGAPNETSDGACSCMSAHATRTSTTPWLLLLATLTRFLSRVFSIARAPSRERGCLTK